MNNVNEPQFYRLNCGSSFFVLFYLFVAMVVAATMTAASMIAANMVFPMMMVVMITPYIRIEIQLVIQKSSNSSIRIARDTAVQLDAGLCQCHLRSTANAAANQHICA